MSSEDGQTPAPRGRWEAVAFEAFYDTHAAALYRYIYFRAGQDQAATAELVADVFLAAWSQPRPPQAESAPLLYGIARRKLADFQRRRRRAEIRFSDLAADEQNWLAGLCRDDAADAATPNLSEEVRRLLGEVLTTLEPLVQEVLLDKYVRGLSVAALAAKLAKSEAATMSLLARARGKLRGALEARMKAGGLL